MHDTNAVGEQHAMKPCDMVLVEDRMRGWLTSGEYQAVLFRVRL